MIARLADGLPADERAPAGYRILRVRADPIDGLPFAAIWRRVWKRRGSRTPPSDGIGDVRTSRDVDAARRATMSPVAKVRSLARAAVRIAAIGLTVRAQAAAARSIDSGGALYHGMAYMGVPVALSLAKPHGSPVVYDARDIYLEARNLARLPRPARWVVGRAERGWARRADRVVTVNSAYADVLEGRLGVPRPLIVMNCSARFVPPASPPRRFHERFGLESQCEVILYHGGLFPDRGIEQLIEAMAAVPNGHLVLMGYGVLESTLPALIAASAARQRVHTMAAVPPEELHDWVAAADIAAMPIQPSTLNHRLTTPNKLFEAMAAGVPVVASDLPGMATIVRETGCGVLCDPTQPASIAAAIRAILDAPAPVRRAFGAKGREAARDTYNWESQADTLLSEYGRLTGHAW